MSLRESLADWIDAGVLCRLCGGPVLNPFGATGFPVACRDCEKRSTKRVRRYRRRHHAKSKTAPGRGRR